VVLSIAGVLVLCAAICGAQATGDGQQQFANLGVCKLISGAQIDSCRLGYRTWGRLNAGRSNAVLFPSWFSGTSADIADSVGADKLLDPGKFFVVAIDAFGDGVSSSPSNSTTQHGPDFPPFTIQDMVNAEYRLATEVLHVSHVHAVMGISMGGIQTFEWMVDYPDFMDEAIPIVGSPRPSSQDLMLYRTDMAAIKDDPKWDGGRYTERPAVPVAELIWLLEVTTPENFARARTRAEFAGDYAKWTKDGILPSDANDWVAQLEAVIHQDVGHGGTMEAAAKRVKAKVLVVSSAQDHMVNPGPALDFARLMGAKTVVLEGDCGHLAVWCEAGKLDPVVRGFLAGK
jgi:homoserine O-acetyltransferase